MNDVNECHIDLYLDRRYTSIVDGYDKPGVLQSLSRRLNANDVPVYALPTVLYREIWPQCATMMWHVDARDRPRLNARFLESKIDYCLIKPSLAVVSETARTWMFEVFMITWWFPFVVRGWPVVLLLACVGFLSGWSRHCIWKKKRETFRTRFWATIEHRSSKERKARWTMRIAVQIFSSRSI